MQLTKSKKGFQDQMTGFIISALIVVVLLVALLPTIVNAISGMLTNDNLSSATKVLIGLLPLFIVIAIVVAFVKFAKAK